MPVCDSEAGRKPIGRGKSVGTQPIRLISRRLLENMQRASVDSRSGEGSQSSSLS